MYILLIEDNPDLVANLYDFLEARKHILDVAYDGHSGLEFSCNNHYDVIVLDLMLPGIDGFTLCERLRDKGITTPVLMLTARDTLNDKLRGFSSGADDYLVKPFAMLELEVRLQALVRRANGKARQRVLRVADLEFNTDSFKVTRAGTGLALPPIPLKILECLMRESPNIVSREQIVRHVWHDNPPETDSLRAHLHMLRITIDRTFDTKLLHTMRGLGYCLAVREKSGKPA